MNKKNNICISVIIPTHNSEKFITECIQSVITQTYKNIQIICVDSSKDNTVSILKSFQKNDSRVEILEDENGSYGHKLNVGVAYAKGDYIAIVESDDYILPNTYECLLEDVSIPEVDYIKSSSTNHFADIQGKRIFCPEYSSIAEKDVNRIIDLEKERELAFVNLPRIWTALYRREFLLENGIGANETPGASFQDTSFTLLVAILAKTCIYKKGAYYCYRNDNQGSSVKSKSKVFCVCDEYKHLERILSEQGKFTEEVSQRILRYKLGTYMWNLNRLDEENAEVFLSGICAELEAYDDVLIDSFTSGERFMYDKLMNINEYKKYLIENAMRIEEWDAFIKTHVNKKYILVGAGNIGKAVLELQKLSQETFILDVGDNNYLQIGAVAGYTVESVEALVEKYPNENYLIANKYHYTDLKRQLMDLGVKKEQITSIGYLSQLDIFKEYIQCFA